MKKTLLALIMMISLFGCSKEDNPNTEKSIPEKFDIKIQIKSAYGSSPQTLISINSFVEKKWDNINLPFEGSYTYYTKGDEISNTACGCITISAWAYLSKIDNIESFSLFVDGKLVKTTNVIAVSQSNGIMNPTILEFVYNP